jgi:hypothetical protein
VPSRPWHNMNTWLDRVDRASADNAARRVATILGAITFLLLLWPTDAGENDGGVERTTTHSVERKEGPNGTQTVTKESTQETDPSDGGNVFTEALDSPGGALVIKAGVATLVAFLGGAAVQRILLGEFAIKVGFVELAEVKRQDAEKAQSDVIKGFPDLEVEIEGIAPATEPFPVYMSVQDPHLKFITVRAELEDRLKTLASAHDLDSTRPIGEVIDSLTQAEVFHDRAAKGFKELIGMGDQAARGATVSQDTADWVRDEAWSMLVGLNTLAERARGDRRGQRDD